MGGYYPQLIKISGIMKINPISVKYYYQTADISTPYDITHRHFRFKTRENNWIKLFRVKNLEDLRKKLVKYAPDEAYISVSCFLEPELVNNKWDMKKAGYKYLSNTILTSDFVMDFDHGVNSLVQMLRAYDYLKKLGFEEFKFIQTKRGFHLWILDWFAKECRKNLPSSPKHREFFLIEKKKALCTKLKSYGIEFDEPISTDTRRIVKLWGSLVDDTFICKAYGQPEVLVKEYIHSKSYLGAKREVVG